MMNSDQIKEYYDKVSDVIDKVGYAIQGVFPVDDTSQNICYTIGLTKKLGYEIITTAPISLQTLYAMIRGVADDLIDKNIPSDTDEFVWGTLLNGDPLRCKLIDVTDYKPAMDFVTVKFEPVTKLYQLMFADSKNILPGEDGYDITFNQTI